MDMIYPKVREGQDIVARNEGLLQVCSINRLEASGQHEGWGSTRVIFSDSTEQFEHDRGSTDLS